MLFTGSVKKNLDPFGEHTDEKLMNALIEVLFVLLIVVLS